MEQVETYLTKQPLAQKEILISLRQLILSTFPGIEENFKYGVPWYQDKFYLVGLKDSVNLGFVIEGLSSKEQALFKGTGKLMRHLKFKSIPEINQHQLQKLLRLVYSKSTPYHR